jgi:hypothetical protein
MSPATRRLGALMSEDTVIILGAGARKACGGPLTAEMLS